MGKPYRSFGDVTYRTDQPSSNGLCSITVPESYRGSSFIQRLQPLSPEHPSFSLTVITLSSNSCVTVGIARTDIKPCVAPGHWNNTVGYHSVSGNCYSSHVHSANTDGQPFGIGDKISVVVSYFGKKSSEVIFYKNDLPVATRYLFESDHTQYLPCIYMHGGQIALDVTWTELPSAHNLSEDEQWIRSDCVTFDQSDGVFSYDGQNEQAFIQSTQTLGKDLLYYDVAVLGCSQTDIVPTIAITTCSPLKPSSPCSLLKDYLKYEPKDPLKSGDHIGWGVHHSLELRKRSDFQPQTEQIVLCYVLKNDVIESFQMMIQPAGGFHPMILLDKTVKRLCVKSVRDSDSHLETELDQIYRDLLGDVRDMLESDAVRKRLTLPMLRLSEALKVDISSRECRVRLPGHSTGIHALQFLHPLSKDSSYFYIEVNKLGASSWVSVGVAGPSMALSDAPGLHPGSVGFSSHTGLLSQNALSMTHMENHKFQAGDKLGVEISCFARKVAVVLFFKNDCPIGTRILNESDRNRYLPTMALYSDKDEVSVNIVWQTRVASAPVLNPFDVNHWCLPHKCKVSSEGVVKVLPHKQFTYIQCPISLRKGFNHFEVELIEELKTPPPIIALSSASPTRESVSSTHQQHFIHFWPVGKASSSVMRGDVIGWGMMLPDKLNSSNHKDIAICYLTVNRNVVHTQPVVLPPGGLYPLVILPPGVDRVKFEFGACWIEDVPITPTEVQAMITDVQRERALTRGDKNEPIYQQPLPQPSLPDHSNIYVECDSKIEHYELEKPTSPKSKKIAKKKSKEKKDKKKASLSKSSDIAFQSREFNYDEDCTDQYQSKTCSIL